METIIRKEDEKTEVPSSPSTTTKEEQKEETTKEVDRDPKVDILKVKNSGDESIRSILKSRPVSVRGKASIVLLFQNINKRNWDEVMEHFERNEYDARYWIEEVNPDGSLRWRSLPIHLVCEKNPPFELIQELLRLYPSCLLEKNYGQDLPIHIACRQGASKEVIRLMLEKNPDTTRIPDCEGRLPLHLACSCSNIHQTSIQDIILYNERATRTPDDFGLLPLHWACTKDSPAINVETVIRAYPFAVEHKDCYGKTPMDRIKDHGHPEKAKIIELLARDVSSWSHGMMSTIVELSSKIGSYEEMKQMLSEKEEECKHLAYQNKEYKDEIKYLTQKSHEDKVEFKEKVRELQRKYMMENKKLEEKFENHISNLKIEKEASEKKVTDLKILLDELLEQLKEEKSHPSPEDRDISRKQLKLKVVELLRMLDRTQQELDKVNEENRRLKMRRKFDNHNPDFRETYDMRNTYTKPGLYHDYDTQELDDSLSKWERERRSP